MHGIIPYMFDSRADPVVLLQSSMATATRSSTTEKDIVLRPLDLVLLPLDKLLCI